MYKLDMDINQYVFADAQHYGIDICSDIYLGLWLGTHIHVHTCIKPTFKNIRLQNLGNARFKLILEMPDLSFPDRWAGEAPDDCNISEIPLSGRQAHVYIHIYIYVLFLFGKKKLHCEWKMLHLLPNLKGCEGKHVTASQTLPASPSLFWTPLIPTQLVESLPPTHCLSCSVSVFVAVFPLSTSHPCSIPLGPDQDNCLLSRHPSPTVLAHQVAFPSFLPPIFGTISPALSGPILFSPSSTLLPLKIYGIFCLVLSPFCLFAYFSYLTVQDPLRSSASPIR